MPLGVEQLARAVLGRSRKGLYGGKRILSGNKVSEDGGNKYVSRWMHAYISRVTLLLSCVNTVLRLQLQLQVSPNLEAQCSEDDPVQ